MAEPMQQPTTFPKTEKPVLQKEPVLETLIPVYIRLFHHEGSTKSITDKKIKVTGQGQEVCTRT